MPLLSRILAPRELNSSQRALDSIEEELNRLLNSRSGLSFEEYDAYGDTAMGYGIPDFSHLHPEDLTERLLLASVVEKVISNHEPRLSDVTVEAELLSSGMLGLLVNGRFRTESGHIKLRFRSGPLDPLLGR